MEEQIKQLTAFMNLMIEDDDFFKAKAKICRKMYDALIEEGFTEEQALQLASNDKQG